MSTLSTKFLQSGDFHLEAVPTGLSEVPDSWRTSLVESPYRAATAVFDAALHEDVDFVVLCGNLLHLPTTGPRGPLFLLDQFARLAAREISIYWLQAGVDEAESWPAGVPLPPNVQLLSPGRHEQFTFERRGRAPAIVLSVARGLADSGHAVAAPYDVPLVAVGTGAPPNTGAHPEIGYWAWGGRHDAATPSETGALVHFAGSPQGRSPDEAGPHGATLVEWTTGERPRRRTLSADAVRWHRERIVIESHWRRLDLESACRRRVGDLLAEPGEPDLLVAWSFAGLGELDRSLRRGELGAEFLDWLRREFGEQRPLVWSAAIEVEPPAELPAELLRQDTMLGDFLRELQKVEAGEGPALDLGIGRAVGNAALNMGEFSDAATRRRILRQAALLGVDLLGGEEVQA